MTILGADPVQLEQMATRLMTQADVYRDACEKIDSWLRRVNWRGNEAGRFFAVYQSRMRPQIDAAAAALQGTASELRAQAAEQIRVSETAASDGAGTLIDVEPCLAIGPHAVRSESLLISSGGSFGLGFRGIQEFPTEVVFREMSDGTFRVSIQSSDVSGLAATMEGPGRLNLGLEMRAVEGSILEFEATTPEGARALRDALEGRASSFTNRTILGGGVDSDEVLGQGVLNRSDVVQLSETQVSSLSGGSIGLFEGNSGVRNEVTTLADRSGEISRTIVFQEYETEGVAGWNHDSRQEVYTIEHHDSYGSFDRFIVTKELIESSDVRGGGEKARDLFFSEVMSNSEIEMKMTTDSYVFSMMDIDDVHGARELLDSGNHIDLAKVMLDHTDMAVHEHTVAEGSLDDATRGLSSVGGSTTGYRTMNVVERSVSSETL